MNRYPGIRPFRQDERPLFFGRNADTERLLRLVRNEQTVVLFGKSGYGKSSLLNAGLYPRLSEEGRYQFWEVRFGPYKKGESALPAEAVCNIASPTGGDSRQIFPKKVFGQSLWQALKNQQVEGGTRFILFFDQFEELFTYPPEQILAFRQQLAEALYSATPEAAIQAFEQNKGLPAETEDLLYAPFELKVVFSIRADRMSLLKQLEDYLPNLLRHSFLLEALDEKQASEAVLMPAALPQEQEGYFFDTPSFNYASETLAAIFRELRDSSGRIETSALQIVCKHVEDNIVAKRSTDLATDLTTFQKLSNLEPARISISPSDLGDLKAVFRAFYDNTIAALDPAEQTAARRLVEDVFIKDGIRLPFAEQALLTEPGVTPTLLEKLERASLLRVELDEQRRKIYEVGHDTLVTPIEEAAKARREAEAQEKERERLRAEADRQLEERKKIDAARRRNILVGLGALALLLFALWKNYQASQAQALAGEMTAKALTANLEATQKDILANLARTQADSAQARADRKTEEARRAAETTAQAMIQLGHSKEQVVEGLAENAKKQIYELQYGEALGTLEAAAKYKRPSFTYTLCALELAYFNNEAGQDGAVAEALALLGGADLTTFKKLSNLSDPKTAQKWVRNFIRKTDPLWFGVLERRYYGEFVGVPGGQFELYNSEDSTKHFNATISPYRMAITEVTIWQYNLYCKAKGRGVADRMYADSTVKKSGDLSWGWGQGDYPVVNINWYDAVDYCNWASQQRGLTPAYAIEPALKDTNNRNENDEYRWTVRRLPNANGYRLPTEAEWQYAAANTGRDAFKYAGSNDLDEVAWYYDNSGNRAHATKTKKPNNLGLFDMSGNVWEWCWDWYGDYPASSEGSVKDWKGLSEGEYRVLRGGSWGYVNLYSRVGRRYYFDPYNRYVSLGFRCAQGY